jgi:two-component system nitrogen regulation response regulator NtrX
LANGTVIAFINIVNIVFKYIKQSNLNNIFNMEKEKRILVVENNDTLRGLLKITLESCRYVVETAHDGLSGLQKLEEDSYDLLITDKQMPRMDGLELIDEICKIKIDIKILLISGGFTREILKHAKARGVMECLSKPFSFKEMIKSVRKVLKEDNVSGTNYTIDKHDYLLTQILQ